MINTIEKISNNNKSITNNTIIYVSQKNNLKNYLNNSELKVLDNELINDNKKNIFLFKRPSENNLKKQNTNIIILIDNFNSDDSFENIENIRRQGDKITEICNNLKLTQIDIIDLIEKKDNIIALIEGISLSSYQFNHKTSNNLNYPQKLYIHSNAISNTDIHNIKIIIDAIYLCKDLVNEPLNYLDTKNILKITNDISKKNNILIQILQKKQIENLKMGGIIAVNKGSSNPPIMPILEWKPKKYKNKKPIIIIGKGILYDTGGTNLKPGEHIEDMKTDMAGAAVALAIIKIASELNLPLHIISIIPITENRIDGNSMVPGDIITMHNGKTVEVANTDAEGRLILADALSFAKKYSPEIVIDVATLTGSAAITTGKYASIAFSNNEKLLTTLIDAGYKTNERIVNLPLWNDYNELLESDVADIKNIGGREAGAITAAKFLQNFVDYNWIHIDIAGTAYVKTKYNYRGKGATGYGIRLIFEFLNNLKI